MMKDDGHDCFPQLGDDPGVTGPSVRWRAVAVRSLLLVGSATFAAGLMNAAWSADDRDSIDGGSFVRRVEYPSGDSVLEIASKRYRRDWTTSEISLVGAVHVGDIEYYRSVQSHLDEHALVLYESVVPRGAARSTGRAAPDRVRATRDSMLFLRRLMLAVRDAAGAEGAPDATPGKKAVSRPPPTLAETVAGAHTIDSRFGHWARDATVDAWGGAITVDADADGAFVLLSLGSDGASGGEGDAADIRLRTPHDRRATGPNADESLQPQLASLLGLAFQLNAVDYDRPNWVVADMSETELLAELDERGVAGDAFLQSLSGSGLTAGVASAAIMMLRVADGLSGGRMREMIKIFLVEVLAAADERTLMVGFPKALVEVILSRRNDVAMNAIVDRLGSVEPAASIALFYGAAHMPDLERRLLADGWKPVSEQWFAAMRVNATKAGIDAASMAQVRTMLQDAMRQASDAEDEP